MDPKLQVALISAVASLVAVTVSKVYELLVERRKNRARERAEALAVASEMTLNTTIAQAIEEGTRTRGLRFTTEIWENADKLALARRIGSYSDLVRLYSDIRLFNILAERLSKLRVDPDYPDKRDRLPREHADLIDLNERILRRLEQHSLDST